MITLTRLVIIGAGLAAGLIGSGLVAAKDLERMKQKNTRIRNMKPVRPSSYGRGLTRRPTTWA